MSPKAKHVLARDHLELALEEIEEAHLGVAATLLLHAAEAAIDALAEHHGIETSPTHWRRAEIVGELHQRGVLDTDDSDLLQLLNTQRKAYAYDGDEPELDVEDVVERVEVLVNAAEEAQRDG